jgi:chromosome segregation ATPase
MKSREDRISELTSELIKRENKLAILAETIEKLNNALSDLKSSESRYNQVIQDQKSQLNVNSDKIQARDKSIYQLNETIKTLQEKISENNNVISMRDTQIFDLNQEVEELRGNYENSIKLNVDQQAQKQAIGHELHKKGEEIRHLQGVLNSIQNRWLYRLYKLFTYRMKRLFFQYPKLFYLILINFMTNAYMSRLAKKHGEKIFPAQ